MKKENKRRNCRRRGHFAVFKHKTKKEMKGSTSE